MNMTYGKAVLKCLIVGLLAATALASVSFAQSGPVAKGSFTLPFAAQWGGLNLNPGTYSFDVKPGGNSYVVHVQQGTEAVGLVMTSVFSSKDAPALSDATLLCVHNSGSCTIGALKMPAFGVLYFNLPESAKSQVAQKPDLMERVPVLFAKN